MAKSFAERVSAARLTIAGIQAHAEELKGIGLDCERATKMEAILSEILEMDTNQERLKAELKTCTANIEEKTKQLDALMQDVKKRVKIVIPQTGWAEFGIADKR